MQQVQHHYGRGKQCDSVTLLSICAMAQLNSEALGEARELMMKQQC
jgi:hypothetical protein